MYKPGLYYNNGHTGMLPKFTFDDKIPSAYACFPQFLPKNLHLICVDMPGHEGTTRSSLDDYSIYGQVKRIHQVKSAEVPHTLL